MTHDHVYWQHPKILRTSQVIESFYCVRIHVSRNVPTLRYGEYRMFSGTWRHIPLSEFPKPFRLALMLEDIE